MMAMGVSSLPRICHPGAAASHLLHAKGHAAPFIPHLPTSCLTGEETEAQGGHGADPGSPSQQVEGARGIQTQGCFSQTHGESGSLLPSVS